MRLPVRAVAASFALKARASVAPLLTGHRYERLPVRVRQAVTFRGEAGPRWSALSDATLIRCRVPRFKVSRPWGRSLPGGPGGPLDFGGVVQRRPWPDCADATPARIDRLHCDRARVGDRRTSDPPDRPRALRRLVGSKPDAGRRAASPPAVD